MFATYQKGVSLGGMMKVCVLIGVLAMVAMKLFPVYKEAWVVKGSMVSVAKLPNAAQATLTDLANSMGKNLQINGVTNLDERSIKPLLKLTKAGAGRKMGLAYDIRSPFFDKLDVVYNFDHTVDLGAGTAAGD
jgi:Tfp pilus assembly protein PilE